MLAIFFSVASVASAASAASVASVASAVDAGGDARPPAGPPPLPQVLERLDQLHRRRDEPAAFAEEQSLARAALARAPQDFGVLWRSARVAFWASDDPGVPNEERSRVGKDGWDLAERAIAANPNHVAGYYWAALCMGNYALGLGVVKALSIGLEGKFRDRLGRAEQLDGRYEHGGIEVAWGRFFAKLPWPKRDRDLAEQHLRKAIGLNGSNLRARVYLASTYRDEDRPADAKRLLDEVASVPSSGPARYDGPEERRARIMAAKLLPQILAMLK
jgi:hypothetical protein